MKPPEGLWDGLAELVGAEDYAVLRVEHEGMIHGANGLTDCSARTVAVRTNMDPAAQVKTLAHELAHVRLRSTTAGMTQDAWKGWLDHLFTTR
ncbi:hypothetical protein Aple_009810 [Acrocarpospora pleiomorpha]|uniref:IrrE N-terminal-like domain-containing protein n=1 Tax=Acrocarpospora pleiomorpha TaxID=90975 RepID=A0A5M3XBS0_9ACTN|nr:ImmA/IrrE family metallo-endopeptidase [Acrocarpospora pleiomorpha]GES18086.1 hypothetical protein Aple_009810 [Acrocarpospora pleiomorpha]